MKDAYKYDTKENTYTKLSRQYSEAGEITYLTAQYDGKEDVIIFNSKTTNLNLSAILDVYNVNIYKYNIKNNINTECNTSGGIIAKRPQITATKIGYCSNTILNNNQIYYLTNSGICNFCKYNSKFDKTTPMAYNLTYSYSSITNLFILNGKFYILTSSIIKNLYRLDREIKYITNGLYIIINDIYNIYDGMDLTNIIEVRNVVGDTEKNPETYIGNGESWKLLHSAT